VAAEHLDGGVLLPPVQRAMGERLLLAADHVGADRLLEREDQPGSDRADDVRRTALLPALDVVEVHVFERIDVLDRAAAGHAWDGVAEQLAPRDQQARRARAADELVRRDEDGVLVVQVRVVACAAGRHLDVHVRRGGGEVPERQRTVAVQQHRDRARVRQDAGHVGRGGEAPDLQWAVGVVEQRSLERVEVDPPVRVLGDLDDVRDRLAPEKLVRVVLVGTDEHDRTVALRDRIAQRVASVEVGREPEPQARHELVDRAGRPRAGEDHRMLGGVAAARVEDDPPRFLTEPRGLDACPR
jgi:hypothetical protein